MHGVAFIGYLLILLAVLQSVFIFGIYALIWVENVLIFAGKHHIG